MHTTSPDAYLVTLPPFDPEAHIPSYIRASDRIDALAIAVLHPRARQHQAAATAAHFAALEVTSVNGVSSWNGATWSRGIWLSKDPVWGDGSPTREFLYSDDAARGIVMATQSYSDPDPVNLGTGKEISIRDLITLICDLMEFKGEIVWQTDQPNGQPRRCLDTDRAKAAFGFVSQLGFEEGLKSTINWYRQHAE